MLLKYQSMQGLHIWLSRGTKTVLLKKGFPYSLQRYVRFRLLGEITLNTESYAEQTNFRGAVVFV